MNTCTFKQTFFRLIKLRFWAAIRQKPNITLGRMCSSLKTYIKQKRRTLTRQIFSKQNKTNNNHIQCICQSEKQTVFFRGKILFLHKLEACEIKETVAFFNVFFKKKKEKGKFALVWTNACVNSFQVHSCTWGNANFIDLPDSPTGQMVACLQEVYHFLIEMIELQLRQFLLNKNKNVTSFEKNGAVVCNKMRFSSLPLMVF